MANQECKTLAEEKICVLLHVNSLKDNPIDEDVRTISVLFSQQNNEKKITTSDSTFSLFIFKVFIFWSISNTKEDLTF
jgi:hypothetical protein